MKPLTTRKINGGRGWCAWAGYRTLFEAFLVKHGDWMTTTKTLVNEPRTGFANLISLATAIRIARPIGKVPGQAIVLAQKRRAHL
jgi:hypothetical protein